MAILRKLFWLALFLVATFCFVVLFEHGTEDFQKNATIEFQHLKKFYGSKVERPVDKSEKTGQ